MTTGTAKTKRQTAPKPASNRRRKRKSANKTDFKVQIRNFIASYGGITAHQFHKLLKVHPKLGRRNSDEVLSTYVYEYLKHHFNKGRTYGDILRHLELQKVPNLSVFFEQAWAVVLAESKVNEEAHRIPIRPVIYLLDAIDDNGLKSLKKIRKQPEYIALQKQIDGLRAELQRAKSNAKGRVKKAQREWDKLAKEKVRETNKQLARLEAVMDMESEGQLDLFAGREDFIEYSSHYGLHLQKQATQELLDEDRINSLVSKKAPKLFDRILHLRDKAEENEQICAIERKIEELQLAQRLLKETIWNLEVDMTKASYTLKFEDGIVKVEFHEIYRDTKKKKYTIECSLWEWMHYGKSISDPYRQKGIHH